MIGEIKRWIRRMSKVTEVFLESVPKIWCRTLKRMRLEGEIGKDIMMSE